MGALKLCTYKKAEYPLYLEMLSLHVYTMEELCYAMESSLFLLDESWMGTEFFQWIAEGVGNAELAGQLRRLYQRHRDVYECAAFLFSASGFYSRQEQKELERIIEKMKGKNSMERRKMKADYYLAKKRYRYAACGYLELLQPEFLQQMTEELQGHIMHNLGVVYARLFLFPEAARMFSMAYQKSHTESSRLCYLYAMNYITEDDSADTGVPELQFKTMKEAYAHFSDVSDQEDIILSEKKWPRLPMLLTGREGKRKFVIDGFRNMSRCIPDEFFINGSVANVMKKRQKGGLKIPLRKSFAVV